MGGKTGTGPLMIGPERLQQMDAQGIDIEVLSINPFWYGTDREVSRKLIQAQNEKLAALCAANPERFVGLATVALQHPDLAAEQLEEGIGLPHCEAFRSARKSGPSNWLRRASIRSGPRRMS